MLAVISNPIRLLLSQANVTIHSSYARALYGAARLGVDKYRQHRTRLGQRLDGGRHELDARLQVFADSRDQMVFTEDLKLLAHVVSSGEDDQALLLAMMIRYHELNKTVQIGNYVFGPVVMRMYWHFELPDMALKAFRCEQLDGFFDQLSSYTLLLDLLLKQHRMADVRAIFELIQTRWPHGSYFPQDCVVLVLAACYQENTAETCDYVRALLLQLKAVGHRLTTPALFRAAALLLNQGAADEALGLLRSAVASPSINPGTASAPGPSPVPSADLYSGPSRGKLPLHRDLEAMCLSELDQPRQAMETLRQPLLADLPHHATARHAVLADAAQRVEASVERKMDAELTSIWRTIKQSLESYGLLQQKTLRQMLLEPIVAVHRPAPVSALGASFNRGERPWRSTPLRPGLGDMVD